MQEQRFKKTIEPWCHFFSNSIPISASIFLLIKKSFNFGGIACFITAYPRECMYNDDIACERGSEKSREYSLFTGALLIVVTLVTFLNMVAIIVKVVKQKKASDRWRISSAEEDTNHSLLMRTLYCCCDCKVFEKKNNHDDNPIIEPAVSSCPTSNSKRIGENIRSGLSTNYEKKSPSKHVAFEKDYAKANACDIEEDVQAKASDIEEGKDTKHNCDKSFAEDDSQEEERQILRAATLVEKSNAITSRSGTKSDPLAFDLRKVRKSIREEREQTLEHIPSDQTYPQVLMAIADSTNSNRGNRHTSDEEKAAIHALLYIGTFFICYISTIVVGFVKTSNEEAPFWLGFVMRTLQPLQGFLFIMVYCRPNVLSLRKNNPEYSRLKAFWIVLKNGGDQD